MTVAYPYALAYFALTLPIEFLIWDIQRNDELSGSGDGSVWQAELAPPLWTATISLRRILNAEAKQINAKIRKLHGAQELFRLSDPLSRFPQLDPQGVKLGSRNVTVESIPGHRSSLSMAGLPASYRFLPGDKFTITYGSNPTRVGFFEISEEGVSTSDGTTGLIGVFPHLPPGVGAGASIKLNDPYCEMKMLPGTHSPGRSNGPFAEGIEFQAIQKR